MPTSKKRISVVVDPELEARLNEYCRLTNTSMSAAVSELMVAGAEAESAVDRVPAHESVPFTGPEVMFLHLFRKSPGVVRNRVLEELQASIRASSDGSNPFTFDESPQEYIGYEASLLSDLKMLVDIFHSLGTLPIQSTLLSLNSPSGITPFVTASNIVEAFHCL